MKRVGVIGANGQVGSEVSLILRNQPGIEVIPICRNRFGSAVLRSEGMSCRHGQIANAEQAVELLRDCDVVANFALASGALREHEELNSAIIENCVRFAPRGATVLHFSTVAVYGTSIEHTPFVWKSAYARSKRRAERLAIRLGTKEQKPVFVLRLGHVAGQDQSISKSIRSEIRRGAIRLPAPGRKSNIVYTATIGEAIAKAAEAKIGAPGIYDLLNVPQWTWREIYAHEAAQMGAPIEILPVEELGSDRKFQFRSIVAGLARSIPQSRVAKEYVVEVISKLSPALNYRAQAIYYCARAAKEIAMLNERPSGGDAAKWREVGTRQLLCLSDTASLLRNPGQWAACRQEKVSELRVSGDQNK